MPNHIEPPREGAPMAVQLARIVMGVQGLATVLQMVSLLAVVEHLDDGPNHAYLVIAFNSTLGVLLLVCAAILAAEWTWARPLAVVVESVGVLSGVVNVASGALPGVVTVLIATGVIVLLSVSGVRAGGQGGSPWRRSYARPPAPGPPARFVPGPL
jgi:hypothetical protein